MFKVGIMFSAMKLNNILKKKVLDITYLRTFFQNYKKYKLKTILEPIQKSITYSLIRYRRPIMFMLVWPTKMKSTPEHKEELKPHLAVLNVADDLFETGKYEECYKTLTNLEEQDDIEIKWRICRVLYNMAKQPKHDRAHKNELISRAYSIIAEELESHWDHFAVQKWYALILDVKSSNDGVKSRIGELRNVRKHMELALKLNPNDATLLHMLGEWCFQITEVPWHQRKTAEALYTSLPYATYEDALDFFLKAEAAHPRFYSINLLRLGCCYLKLKKEDQAKYYLQLAASYPAKSNDDHRANKEATELLRKLKVKPDFTMSP